MEIILCKRNYEGVKETLKYIIKNNIKLELLVIRPNILILVKKLIFDYPPKNG